MSLCYTARFVTPTFSNATCNPGKVFGCRVFCPSFALCLRHCSNFVIVTCTSNVSLPLSSPPSLSFCSLSVVAVDGGAGCGSGTPKLKVRIHLSLFEVRKKAIHLLLWGLVEKVAERSGGVEILLLWGISYESLFYRAIQNLLDMIYIYSKMTPLHLSRLLLLVHKMNLYL